MRQVIVIPARMKGTRLPGKPLLNILGKAIIHHVWDRCKQVIGNEHIYIATEDESINEYCIKNKIQCVVTQPSVTAIDRIYFFSKIIEADAYINIQGDEPIVNIKDISTLLNYNKNYPERVVFGKTKACLTEFTDISKAKVVCDITGRLLYSSRAGIPVNNRGDFVSAERAIWLYAFNKKALESFYFYHDKTTLDKIEDNEVLRFLEIGIPVYCIDMIGDSWAVDEPKDIKIVENRLSHI